MKARVVAAGQMKYFFPLVGRPCVEVAKATRLANDVVDVVVVRSV